MADQKGLKNIGVFFYLLVILAIVPTAAIAQPNPSWSDDARCDRWAVRVADAVKQQVPGLPAVPPQVKLYFELVQREPFVPSADHRIFYGGHYTKFGDLRLPKGSGPFPVAIVVHGGGWQSRVNLDYIAPLAEALRCAGIATWSIEYRRLGADGVWPAMFQDVAYAADFLRQLALYYPLDLSRVVTVGHSSGGHLALWLAARDRLPADAQLYTPNPLPILGTVSLAGTGDLARFVEVVPMYYSSIIELLGGGSEEQIAERMWEVSPVEHLPLGKPLVIINGEFDPYVPLLLAQEYMELAAAAGDDVKLITLKGAGHFESTDPADPVAGPAIRQAVLSIMGLFPSGKRK
jgi:acetyl esterase/lipase